MIQFQYPFLSFSADTEKHNLQKILRSWTQIPFTSNDGYSLEEVKDYDQILGELLRQAEHSLKRNLNVGCGDFLESWVYQGTIYRVMHGVVDDQGYASLPKVNYHRMVTHWTNNYTFEGLPNKISRDERCIILEANTGNHIAFDVNGFRRKYGCQEPFTEKEHEIIFPMYKDCIKEYRMSINEFAAKKKKGML